MTRVMLNYEGLKVCVGTDASDDAVWLEEFLLPWFAPIGDTPDVTVTLTYDGARFQDLRAGGPLGGQRRVFMLDTRTLDLPCWNVPGHDIALYDADHHLFYLVREQHIELVAAEAHTDSRINLMRVVRELAMGIAQLRGHRFLHASAFSLNGRAAIISGRREAGKTSLLTYALTRSPGGFLTNDRLLVRTAGAATTVRGMPTIVSIRDGTMDLFPGMREQIGARGYRCRATLAEAQQPEKLALIPAKQGAGSITPRQFCTLLGREPVAEAKAAVLLFPRQSGQPGGLELRRLDASTASMQLRQGLFGHIGPDRLSEVFTVLPTGLTRRRAPDDHTLCQQLAASVPAWECLLGRDSYRDSRGADALLELLNHDCSPDPGN
ncbi:hypothetical protein Q6D67_16960 [Haliea sp. E1-2-M8]|uniref:hypothetical protein n=1 Tax=Haliea sp. E1-2-M8 TaxID=3064706 RepID=UPI0027292FEE|nr:hypothetical protein [Haliea sp. E1-2-M8]MDO8863398.1 hypothetical protein [Haliea sp. E1-2-M8]